MRSRLKEVSDGLKRKFKKKEFHDSVNLEGSPKKLFRERAAGLTVSGNLGSLVRKQVPAFLPACFRPAPDMAERRL
ncbi:MAG: hypothetical protein JW764_04280 [Chlorobiaceae bacterium]|nr:hypothetical protein [Chlorobiaceae bacterium]